MRYPPRFLEDEKLEENIVIRESTTYGTEEVFDYLVENGKINPSDIVSATINYNLKSGLPYWECDISEYPLQLRTCYGKVIYIYCATAGYGGTGPNTSVDILRKVGFDVDENYVFTPAVGGIWRFKK